MEGRGVWDVVSIGEAYRLAGKRPLMGRWVDCNKGGRGQCDVRCRWVATEAACRLSDPLFVATPPLEAFRLVLSEAATGSGSRK
eukprot:14508150-Alexandrium_andersonii.AAC.1